MEHEILLSLPPTLNKHNKKGSISAVRRWIMRGTSTINPTLLSPPIVVSPATRYQRGRSQSLDAQALERSGVRSLPMNVIYIRFLFNSLKTSF